jgi:hypothetical protein
MPQETLFAIVAVSIPFVIFALVLAWSDYHSRDSSQSR